MINRVIGKGGWTLLFAFGCLAGSAGGRQQNPGFTSQVEQVIAEAYRSASVGFPCELKTRGKPRMLRWESVDRCLNAAADKVDWERAAGELDTIRAAAPRISAAEFDRAVEAALDAQALSYSRLFKVKNPEALLPLTNSLLKYLPADSLSGLPVIDKVGTELGAFAGTYSYERTGGLAAANTYRLIIFQYKDRNGNMQSAADKLLLDSFGVPWSQAAGERGFRLPSDRLRPGK
ncbi:MAG: hypothetical protein FJW35_00340 [Acidobacteria bacterium]|nr:hypothetical protein [Acidobacteriota bacterium]